MGRATILGGGTDGSYTIKIDYGMAKRTGFVTAVDARLAKLAPLIVTAQAARDAQKANEDAAKVTVTTATNEYVTATQTVFTAFQAVTNARALVESLAASPTATEPERTAAQIALTVAEAAYSLAQTEMQVKLAAQVKASLALVNAKIKTAPLQYSLDLLNDEQKKLLQERSYLIGLTLEDTRQAWCADFTEGGSGVVGTAEIPGESNIIIIKPAAPAASSGDGQLQAREIMSPAQAYLNAAILPGWQKFKPTYRRGIITVLDKDANKANVSLTDDRSSAIALGVNQTSTLTNVPVVYMTCNAKAFKVGDNCLVQFTGQAWGSPVVVGFSSNPRPCPYTLTYVYPNSQIVVPTAHEQKVLRGEDGEPVTTIPVYHNGLGYEEEFYQWDDGLALATRQELNVQMSKTYTARYLSFKGLYIKQIDVGGSAGNFTVGYDIGENEYVSEYLSLGGFPDYATAYAYRFPEFRVTRTAFGRVFNIIYTNTPDAIGQDHYYVATSSDK